MGLHPQRTARRAAAELAKWGGEGAAQVSGTHAVGVHLKGPKANTMKNQRGPKRRPPPPRGCRGSPGAFCRALLHLSLCLGWSWFEREPEAEARLTPRRQMRPEAGRGLL